MILLTHHCNALLAAAFGTEATAPWLADGIAPAAWTAATLCFVQAALTWKFVVVRPPPQGTNANEGEVVANEVL